MEHLYGHRWTGQYGRAANERGELTLSAKLWAADLGEFQPEQIRGALEATERQHTDWPPTVPQFKALCRGVAPTRQDPRMAALLKANADFQLALTDARLGVAPVPYAGPGAYSAEVTAGLEAIGGRDALLRGPETELAPVFVRAHMAAAKAVAEVAA